MQFIRTAIICCFTLLTLLSGCVIQEPVSLEPVPPVQQNMPVPPGSQAMQDRFTEPQERAGSAVETAVTWSQRYDQLSVKTEQLRTENTALILENNELKQKISLQKAEIDQIKKELSEANDFLGQMELQLTKWKTDVLGYRDEIRKAHTAQLQALIDIKRLLGAEVTEPEPAESDKK